MNPSVNNFTKEEAQKWLKDHGLTVSGTRDELLMRIRKFSKFPKLWTKLKSRTNSQYKFPTSLDPLEIPPINAPWYLNYEGLPKMNESTFQYFKS